MNLIKRRRVVTAFIVLVMLGGCSTGSSNKNKGASTPTVTPTITPTKTTPLPVETPTTAAPTPTRAPASITYRGSGNKILKIKKPEAVGAVLITTTISGPSDNNTIYTLDDSLHEDELLVNTIGSYKGTSIMDNGDKETKRLKLAISGRWTVTLKSIADAKIMRTSYSGRGDDVLLYGGPTGVMKVKNTGPEDNFTINYYTEANNELLVNEIGSYSGETTIQKGPGLLEIDGGGRWTLSVTP